GSGDAGDSKDGAHPGRGELWIAQQAGAIGEAEDVGEMHQGAGALLPTQHDEVRLVAVQVGQKDNTRLVEPRRRGKDVAGERHRRLKGGVELRYVTTVECAERGRGSGANGVENAEQGVAVAVPVAGNELRVIEIVARVHAYSRRQSTPKGDLALL